MAEREWKDGQQNRTWYEAAFKAADKLCADYGEKHAKVRRLFSA
jgi:hypothetical protein